MSAAEIPAHLVVIAALLLVGGCCSKGSPGDLIRLDEAINDPEAYAERIDRECANGRAESCTHLGIQTAFGTYGRTQDHGAAIGYFETGCDGGDAYGCHELGVAHMYGRGVPEDRVRAREIFEGSCDGGVSNSCYYIAGFYERGEGVDQDADRAHEYYAKACDAGDSSACDR